MNRSFSVGDIVKIVQLPPFLKTAEPMPMLRSAELVKVGEEGRILEIRPAGYFSIRFANGAFLIDGKYIDLVQED
ncbi:MAG: regulatory protein SipA [Synechococcus sp.]